VLYNPVDTTIFRPAPAIPSLREGWQLLAAGTHYQPFRVIGALETARALLDVGHRVQLTVAGAMRWPDAETQVHEAIGRLNLAEHVTLRPAFNQEEAVRLYQAAHVLLHLKVLTILVRRLRSRRWRAVCRWWPRAAVGCRNSWVKRRGNYCRFPGDYWRASYPPPRRVAAAVAGIIAELPRRRAAARERAARMFDKVAWVEAHSQIFEQVLSLRGKREGGKSRRMKPAITVLMSVHNGMPFLPDAVKSILAQSFGDFEFLILNDASTDGTAEYLNRVATRECA
jgi:hypothetical protein